jgi:hypothetical protein
MPNGQGLYYLSDMQDRIRRLLDAVSYQVNSTSGVESNLSIEDQSISNTELTNNINESLMRLYAEMMEGRDSLFAVTSWMSTVANNPGPYVFPANMLNLRWMKWRRYGYGPTEAPYGPQNVSPQGFPWPGSPLAHSIRWYPMTMIDDPADYNSQHDYNAPTWRWEGGGFILNWAPEYNNPNGIMLNYTVLAPELVNANDTITLPKVLQLVRFVQQAVIYDAAVSLESSKKKMVNAEHQQTRDNWHARVITETTNAYRTQSMQMVAPQRMGRQTFTGRRHRRSWGYRNGGGWD